MTVFQTDGNRFVLDGKPVRIISGAIHYFRVVPDYWFDRLNKLKACGFNTVETYIPWNLHEPQKGRFHFEGIADVVRFMETAAGLGLHVIIRPSPYICAEWEFGGLPSWLLAESDTALRCAHPSFLAHVDDYYDVLMPLLKPLLCTSGGPIIAMQIENEYGSYGNDLSYLQYMRDSITKRGIDVLLVTSDGPEDICLQSGMIPGVLGTVNFGSNPEDAFAKLQQYQPDQPLMCMEYWNGWFDHWGKKHVTRESKDTADVFDRMLEMGASVNFYMFHGGTNFGFYNGANNHTGVYEPIVTSYDYDAPLSEAGDPTAKYFAIREVLSKYTDLRDVPVPEPSKKKAYGKVRLSERADLFDSLPRISRSIRRISPEPMEKLGQDYGFILYSTFVSGPKKACELIIEDIRDRAIVFVNGTEAGVLERWKPTPLRIDIPPEGARIEILVENMGRVNYGPYIKDTKGITSSVRLQSLGWCNQFLFDWNIRSLPMNDLSELQFHSQDHSTAMPAFYKGTFQVAEAADTFLDVEGWSKGVAFINGFNLGRYWSVGPQRRLYVPAPLLRQGSNEIVLFDLHGVSEPSVTFHETSSLG